MLLSKKELEIYEVEQCNEFQLRKIKEFYKKLNIDNLMTLKGFYLMFWKELKVLNLKKIHNFEQLCKKCKKYKKERKERDIRMKIYIAGKITGLDNYKELFEKAETMLLEEGHAVMNPAILWIVNTNLDSFFKVM